MKMTVTMELQTGDFLLPDTPAEYKWEGSKDIQIGDTLLRVRLAEDMLDTLAELDVMRGRNRDLAAAMERKRVELLDKGCEISNLSHQIARMQGRIELLEKALQVHVTKEGVEAMLLARIDEGKLSHENKIACIKYVRDVTPWGLKESKDFVVEVLGRCFSKPTPVLDTALSQAMNTMENEALDADVIAE